MCALGLLIQGRNSVNCCLSRHVSNVRVLQRYGLRLVAISEMYRPSNRKTSAVSLFCTIGIIISKTPPCPAVVSYRATICSSSSGIKAAFGCPRLSYRSTWPSMKQVVTDEYERHCSSPQSSAAFQTAVDFQASNLSNFLKKF